MAKQNSKIRKIIQPNRRQLAKWQKQRRLERIALIGGGIFVLLILLLVGLGYYATEIRPMQEVVIRVNDTEYDLGYYTEALKLYLSRQDASTYNMIAYSAADSLIGGELMRQKANNLGIKIDSETVKETITRLNLKENIVVYDVVYAQLLQDRIFREIIDPAVPKKAEQVRVNAVFVNSEKAAKEVIAKLQSGSDFATLTKNYSNQYDLKAMDGNIGWIPRGLTKILLGSQILEDVAFSLDKDKLSQPVYDGAVLKEAGYWVIKVAEKSPDTGIRVYGIIVATEEEAEAVKARIDSGEDFTTVAKLVSKHEESRVKGGDLGWINDKTGDKFSTVLNETAQKLEIDSVSKPIFDNLVITNGGYWVVKTLEKEAERELDAGAREKLFVQAFNDWLSEIKERSKIENLVTESIREWALSQVTRGKK